MTFHEKMLYVWPFKIEEMGLPVTLGHLKKGNGVARNSNLNKAFSPMCTDGGEEQNLEEMCHQASQRGQYHAHEVIQM